MILIMNDNLRSLISAITFDIYGNPAKVKYEHTRLNAGALNDIIVTANVVIME